MPPLLHVADALKNFSRADGHRVILCTHQIKAALVRKIQPHPGRNTLMRTLFSPLRAQGLLLLGGLKFFAVHFPFDAHEKIEMHTFSFEPAFEGFAGIGTEFDKHFSFEHVDENALGASCAAGLHSLCESFSAL